MAGQEIFNDLNLVLQLNQHIQKLSLSRGGGRAQEVPTGTTGVAPSSPNSPAKQTSFKVLTDLSSVTNPDPREDAQFEHQRAVFLSVNSSDLPFHLQGDQEFNEASALAKRRALRFSEAVKTRIEFLWEVAGGRKQAELAQRLRQQEQQHQQGRGRNPEPSVRRATAAANNAPTGLPALEELDEQDYMALMLLIFKVLRDDFVLESAYKQIQCDWEVDSHHGQTLSFEQFYAAFFELVDVWTCDVEEATYERFLELLARRITRRVAVFLDGAELKLALSDNFDPAVVVKAIPLRTIPKFASVARVVAATGMTTVGELARADPQMVERERVGFLQRKDGGVSSNPSQVRKIGQDLQALLAMFQGISRQFAHVNYSLENNILRKIPSVAKSRLGSRGNTTDDGQNDAQKGVHGSRNGDDSQGISRGNPGLGGGAAGEAYRGAVAETGGRSNPGARQVDAPGGRQGESRASDAYRTAFDAQGGSEGKGSQRIPVGKSGNDATTKSSVSEIQPINSIHELQIADTDVVNALRSTFLIEKGISLERQTERNAVRAELLKFGVDPESFSDEVAWERYGALYDLLVLRDGESLKALAGVMLEQIKLELAAHGIIVNDEEVEEMYDGFYDSVIAGTGDSIVKDAQRWVETTVEGNTLADYIQNDFHELKPIDDVALLGTKRGDEEFLSLLAKDTDVVEEEEHPQSHRRRSLCRIQRKPSQAAVVSVSDAMSPEAVGDILPQKPPSPPTTKASDKDTRKAPHNEEPPTISMHDKRQPEEPHFGASEKKRRGRKKKNPSEAPSKAVSIPSSTRSTQQAPLSSQIDAARGEVEEPPTLQQTTDTGPNFEITLDDELPTEIVAEPDKTELDENTKHENEDSPLGPPLEATSESVPDHGARRKLTLPPRRTPSKMNVDVEAVEEEEKGEHLASEQEMPCNMHRIAFEMEGDDAELSDLSTTLDAERPIMTEPKVPKIVIGGTVTGKNVPVTARYVQLLGVGIVVVPKDERDFFQLLRSHEAKDIDLVCYDIGIELDTALARLQSLHRRVGKRVILFGGNSDEPERTEKVVYECLAQGALYFAAVPFNFPRLREKILSYFENAKQPYILRQRKPPGKAAQLGSRSIGPASLFALHDEPRKVSTPVGYAKTPRRKPVVTIPALPSLSQPVKENSLPLKNSGETRRPDFTPAAPGSPRPTQSRTKSPRLSAALNKLIR